MSELAMKCDEMERLAKQIKALQPNAPLTKIECAAKAEKFVRDVGRSSRMTPGTRAKWSEWAYVLMSEAVDGIR